MDDYNQSTYGDRIADIYDEWYSGYDPAQLQTLVELAHGGNALELGIGTGRVALPLKEAGIQVFGLDASEAMVAKLRAKTGGETIPVTMSDFADVAVEGQFDLVYVVFNTFFTLLSQEDQVRCFQNVAEHLAQDGVFVIEAFVPDMTRFTAGQAMRVGTIGDKHVQIDVSEIDFDKQLITSQHLVISEQGNKFYPVKIRYCWPSELDLMAQLAHLRLRERWSDWGKSKFSAQSQKHISIYEQQS